MLFLYSLFLTWTNPPSSAFPGGPRSPAHTRKMEYRSSLHFPWETLEADPIPHRFSRPRAVASHPGSLDPSRISPITRLLNRPSCLVTGYVRQNPPVRSALTHLSSSDDGGVIQSTSSLPHQHRHVARSHPCCQFLVCPLWAVSIIAFYPTVGYLSSNVPLALVYFKHPLCRCLVRAMAPPNLIGYRGFALLLGSRFARSRDR